MTTELPPPVTTEQAYMAAIVDELRGLRADMAGSPTQPSEDTDGKDVAVEEIREPVTTQPADAADADDEKPPADDKQPRKTTRKRTSSKRT